MPEMDGLEATANIRAQERDTGSHIPIVAMTAHVMQGDRERCLEAGMDAYVAKPIQAEELFATLEGLLPDMPAAPVEAAASAAAGPLFDPTATLRCVDGDRELLREVAHLFSDACAEMLTDMESAIDKHDALRLRQLAHTLKGEASNFGAAAAVAAAQRLEAMGRDEDLAHVHDAYTALENALEQLLPALMAFAEQEEPSA